MNDAEKSSLRVPLGDGERSTSLPRIILASGFQAHYVREVANAYARLGHCIEVIGGDMHADLDFEENVRFLNLRGYDRKEYATLSELAKLARYYIRLLRHVAASKSPAIYDVSIGRPFLRCVLMYSAFRLLRKRIIYTAHNVLPHDRDTPKNRLIFWVIYRIMASVIVVHGQSLKDRLVQEFGVASTKVHVIPHGTYHPPDDPALTKREARDRLGLPHSRRIALVFGLQRPYKGTHFAIKALQSAPIENLTLLIRGEVTNPAYGRELQAVLASASSSVAIDSRLEPVPDSEMELLFKACDVVLLPYLEGSQSGVKYMAFAFGKPVLASDAGSIGESVASRVSGEIFKTGDEVSFLSTLEDMLNNLSRYDEVRIRTLAREEFSFDAAVRIVDALIEGRGSSAASCASTGGTTS
ncbi:MAG: glycosyltransferase family 4 protein [Candidatus Hydrogenedentales bacterium]|jgi:glycosyltransferase involved in cell wall biosynthesis